MTETLSILLCLLVAWLVAICSMRRVKPRTGVYSNEELWERVERAKRNFHRLPSVGLKIGNVYDPTEDPERILKGEVEGYFN